MYRVLIVDDETYIVDCLSELLESRPELDVCCANSVAEAIVWLNRAKIDIIITDIRMPEMSGIALAEKVKLNWPQCKIIFLTAHADFDYAYEAIKNNVIGYILKIESSDRILTEVDKAIAMLDKEMKNLELLEQVQDQLTLSGSVIRKEIIISILKEDCDNPLGYFEQLKNIGTDISAEKPFIVFSCRIKDNWSQSDIVERFRQFSSVQRIVEQYLLRYFYCNCVEYSFNKIVWLMQHKDGECLESEESDAISGHEFVFVAGMLEIVQQACMETSGISVSFALHGKLINAEHLPECFHSLDRLLSLHNEENTGFVIIDTAFEVTKEEDMRVECSLSKQINSNSTEILKTCLENNNHDEYIMEFEKISLKLSSFTSWHNTKAWGIYYYVANAIVSFMNQHELAGKVAARLSLRILLHPQLADSWNNLVDYLREVSEVLFDLYKSEQQESSSNTIYFIKKYIDVHISQDVSLIKLSEVSGYNATYLSKIFKKNTGETISDYIGQQKISKIKELMADNDLSINDIAVRAGFEYRTYFNRFVKKVTGMSPQALRNLQQHGIK